MIRVRRMLGSMMVAIAACAVSAAEPACAAARGATRDWSQVAARSPSGSFVQGNPDARVKLVEYLSLTCPHCANFEAEAIRPLTEKYIRTGLVSYEVRHALRDAFDFAGSVLARCDGPEAFFTRLPAVFAQQDSWFARAQTWAQTAQADNLPPDQLLPQVAAGAGFEAVFAMPAARVNACLTNHDEQAELTTMAGQAWRLPGFPGTPAFAINGSLEPDIRTWADLDARLAAMLKSSSPPRKINPR